MARKNTVVGLDIGRHSVKAVWAELRRGVPVFLRCEMFRLPPETSNPSSVVVPWIQKMGIHRLPCVLGLPGTQTMFQPFSIPSTDPRTLEQIATMEVIRFNEMASETMLHNLAPFSLQPGERRFLLAMVRPTVVQELLANAKNMGLDVVDIVPTPVALFNALETREGDVLPPCAYVNVGYAGTDIAVGSPSGLMFARSFGTGGRMFTDALAKSAGLPAARAENAKLTDGSLLPQDKLSASLLPAADMWFAEVQSCLAVFKSLFGSERVQPLRVGLAGGGSALKGFPEYVSRKWGVEAARVPALPGDLAKEAPTAFAVAAGLALAGLRAGRTTLSLLPPRVRDELVFRRQKPFWIAAGVAAALTLAVSLLGEWRDFRKNEKKLNAQKISLQRRQQLADEIEAVKARSRQVRDMSDHLKALLSSAPLLRDVTTLVAASKAPEDWVTAICDADLYFSRGADASRPQKVLARGRRPGGATDGANSNRVQRIMIEGYTRSSNFSTVKDLIVRLCATNLVASADLLGDEQTVEDPRFTEIWNHPFANRFVVDVKVANP